MDRDPSLYDFSSCRLCPRACGADRTSGVGFCGVSDQLTVARAALHFWEEPCISGKTGAGTIFFSGCPLHCSYCQNREISTGATGKIITASRLREICFELKAAGACCIDLVTPAHFAPQLRQALLPIKPSLGIPFVVNTGGYDSPLQLSFFKDLADVYLPDFKYADSCLAAAASNAPDYPLVALQALREMVRQVGKPAFDRNGVLVRGVLVRHLILPGKRKESVRALSLLGETFKNDEILLSLMSQYVPVPGLAPPFDRPITTFELQSVLKIAEKLGFNGYSQDRSSSSASFLPPFDFTGV